MRHHLRNLLTVLALLAVLAGLLTFPSGWGCRLAERIVRRLEPVNAIPGLVFRFRHVSATRVEIGGVALGSETGAPGLERLTVRFTPRGLLRRTLDSVVCEGLHARMIVGSNRVTLVGVELLEGVILGSKRETAAAPWRLGEATLSDMRIQLVPERDDHGWPDEIAGTLRLRNAGHDTYQLLVRGSVLEIPFWGTGEGCFAARGGELTATFPLVPITVVREALARFVPHAPRPPLDGVCHLSVRAGFTNAVPERVTVLAMTRGPLHIEAGDQSLTLSSLVAAVNWRPGQKPWGDLTKVSIEGRLAGLNGLPAAMAAGLDQAQFRLERDPVVATPEAADAVRLCGHLMLPALAPLVGGVENRLDLCLAAATNRIRLAVQVPPLAGARGAGDAAVAWQAAGLGLQAEARREAETGAWHVSGAGVLSNACVTHALAHASNVTVRVPFQSGRRPYGVAGVGSSSRQSAVGQSPTLSRALSQTLSKAEEEAGTANGREWTRMNGRATPSPASRSDGAWEQGVPFQAHTVPAATNSMPFVLGTPEIAWGVARLLGAELAPPVMRERGVSRPGYLFDETFRIGATGSALQLEASVAVSRAGGVEAGLRCGPMELTEHDPLVAAGLARIDLPAAIRETLAFSGLVSLDGHVVLQPGREPVWHGAAGLEAGRVTVGGAVTGSLDGLRTALRVDGVGPRARVAPLLTTFTNGLLAGLEIRGGTIHWRLGDRELLVEKAEFDWCGGKARVYAVRVDLARPDIDFVLYIDRMDAGELIRLIKPLDGTATGHLYGRLPLRIRQGRILLSEGFLYALPGERGNLKLRDTRFLRDYFERAGLSSAMRKNLADALADLDYDVLRVDLSTTAAREGKLVLKLAGQAAGNRELPPVDLDIRVNGPLEALLNLGLQVNKAAP